ncbi:hypothetical protein ACQP1V_10105 [Microtetraspora malaysiensis]|uniref:hypothetical protein n=1 Tax=Microtetraspora malaysiensis TaxID=161358 RepID=UPI003D8D0F09
MVRTAGVSGIVGPLAFTALYGATIDAGDGWVWVCGTVLYVLCAPAFERAARECAGPTRWRDRAVHD